MGDNVNHPSHYKAKNGLEAITVINSFTEDLVGPEAVYTANVLKYMLRWKHKNGLEDLLKAEWYLRSLIDILGGENKRYDKYCNYGDLRFTSLGDAEDILRNMNEVISSFGVVSVSDLFDMVGKDCPWMMNGFGWTDLQGAKVVLDLDGGKYALDLPMVKNIK